MFDNNDDEEMYDDELFPTPKEISKRLNEELRITFYNNFKSSEDFREEFIHSPAIPHNLKITIFDDLLRWKENEELYEECSLINEYKNRLTINNS